MESPSKPPAGGAVYIGTAAWTIPKLCRERFPLDGSHLERYACRLNAVEINSSFYRPHQPKTYARWRQCVPAEFRFAVKVPRAITHERQLKDSDAVLAAFLDEAQNLGSKLGPLLVQLPPRLAYERERAETFFETLRRRFTAAVVCEPRHPTWFTPDVARRLTDYQIARVAADPAVVPEAAEPGAWPGLVYYRLHGSPEMYHSAYAEGFLRKLGERIRQAQAKGTSVWCIFDNTARGAASANALDLAKSLGVMCAASPPPRD